jgi:hypothetical protein
MAFILGAFRIQFYPSIDASLGRGKAMSGWGCPHEINGMCQHVKGRACDPGMKGCVLAGRFRFSNAAKNRPPRLARDGGGVKPDPGRRGAK